MGLTEVEVIITSCREPFDWYRGMEGSIFLVVYDPYVEKYLTLNKGGASRYIHPEDCEVLEKRG